MKITTQIPILGLLKISQNKIFEFISKCVIRAGIYMKISLELVSKSFIESQSVSEVY